MANRTIDKIIIHCADTYADMDIGAAEIRKWHVEERHWNDIGYHWVCTRPGLLEAGRPEGIMGAHVAGMNKHSIGICLVGGKPRYNFTGAQMNRLVELVREIKLRYPTATIHGHNEFSDKDCPGFDVQVWAEDNLKG